MAARLKTRIQVVSWHRPCWFGALIVTMLGLFCVFKVEATPSIGGSFVRAVAFDGSDHNLSEPTSAAAGSALYRLAPNAYEDGHSEPRVGTTMPLPSARAVSNAVSAQTHSVPNNVQASDWLWQWGQFLDHDLDLTPASTPAQAFDIVVPIGDLYFDPQMTGSKVIEFNRSQSTLVSGVREQLNQVSAYIDGSQIYGSDALRAMTLRDMGNDGKMKMQQGANGEAMLMFNTFGLENDNGGRPAHELFASGDIRANEQIGLLSVHTLFSREHNRLASTMKDRLDNGDAALNDLFQQALTDASSGVTSADDFLYQSTRRVVSSLVQKITYEEFLPMLLGDDALVSYAGYDETLPAQISNEFSTAAYRLGHSMLSPQLLRVDDQGQQIDAISLRNAFFNVNEVWEKGIDTLLSGLGSQAAQNIDTLLIEDVRNFLFGRPGSGGFDLASLNIQRGRDHGLQALNPTRVALGLDAYQDFLSLTGGDIALAQALSSVYATIDDVDLWIGGLAEQHFMDALVGETFRQILIDQFTRSRDGDRFHYQAWLEELMVLDPEFLDSGRLSDIIRRNSSSSGVQDNVFLLAASGPLGVDEPAVTALLYFAIALFLALRGRHSCTVRI